MPTMEAIQFPDTQRTGPLRSLHLKRLERLAKLRKQHARELNQQGIRLLDRALFAAYCDCRDSGAEDEARRILRGSGYSPEPARGAA
jgi:hypothetical protein